MDLRPGSYWHLMILLGICTPSYQALTPRSKTAQLQISSLSTSSDHYRQKRKIFAFDKRPDRKWSLPIKYHIDPQIPAFANNPEFKDLITNVVANIYPSKTCITFEELDVSQPDLPLYYINFTHNDGVHHLCQAFTGRHENSTVNQIKLGDNCFQYPHYIVQLVASVLGMFGEQMRPDRDQYVEVLMNNVDQSFQHMFLKIRSDILTYENIPYDIGSLMQAAPTEYSKASNVESILPWDLNMKQHMGQSVGLSYFDYMALNSAYCQNRCPPQVTCQHGGYQNPADCGNCLCPDGFAGKTCQDLIVGSCSPATKILDATDKIKCLSIQNYQAGEQCSWIINSPSGHYVQFWFNGKLQLPYDEESLACSHWVEIKYNGTDSIRGPRYCSMDHMPVTSNPLKANNQSVLVLFMTENLIHEKTSEGEGGFQLCFNATRVATSASSSSLEAKDLLMIVVIILLILLILIAIIILIVIFYRKSKRPPVNTFAANQPDQIPTGHANPGYMQPTVMYTPSDTEKAKLEKELQEISMTYASGFQTLPKEPPPKYDDHEPPNMATPTYANIMNQAQEEKDLEDKKQTKSHVSK